jgi:uncharacterized protein YndB with AHSA1/START domain
MNQNTVQARAAMLIRKPVAQVFEAFTNPEITTRFWFTRSTGKLETGKQVEWYWDMYDALAKVQVKAIEPNKRILIEWSDPPNTVEWVFTARADNTTFVSITNSGYAGTQDEIVSQAIESTEAFTLVLIGLKALLEHNINLNLILDRFPPE